MCFQKNFGARFCRFSNVEYSQRLLAQKTIDFKPTQRLKRVVEKERLITAKMY